MGKKQLRMEKVLGSCDVCAYATLRSTSAEFFDPIPTYFQIAYLI
jgi:hypothetical protein